MANYELHILSKIVKGSNPEASFNEVWTTLEKSPLFTMHHQEFMRLFDYRMKYGTVPGEEAFGTMCPGVELPEAIEPLKFYVEESHKNFIYSVMAELNDQVVKHLKASDPLAALKAATAELEKAALHAQLSEEVDLAQTVDARIQKYDDRRNQGPVVGIPSGWSKLDLATTGWQKGELTFLVGRMGSFKSWVMIAWACYAWLKGFVPLFLSREMGYAQLSRRIDAFLAAVRFLDIKTGVITDEDFQKFQKSLKNLFAGKHPFWLVDSAGVGRYDMNFVSAKIKQKKPDIAFLDGVYLILGEGGSEWERQTSITRGLKQISLTENIPIIGSTQANRGSAGKNGKIGTENTAYSDSYGQDADNMVSLVRRWDKVNEKYSNKVLVELIKVRDADSIRMEIEVNLDAMRIAENTMSQFSAHTPA